MCLNVSTTPIAAIGCWQGLPLSVVQLRGKHCRNGDIDMFGLWCLEAHFTINRLFEGENWCLFAALSLKDKFVFRGFKYWLQKLKTRHNCSLLAHVSPQFWEIMLVISSWQRRCRTSLLAISFEHFETGLDQSRVNYCFWHAIAILYVTGSSKSSQVSSYVFQSKSDYEISRSLNCPNIRF